ncbi:MAG: hypothetical protein N3A62_05065 [Thermodesulfovibrionales bacterium]|nr:hypothetical protein [Thermodesulfovibrionales bacterium]
MFRILLLLVCAVSLGFFVVSAMAVPAGKNVEYQGGALGKVVFDGKIHADKGMKCNDCHTSIFSMKKEVKITMEDHKADKFCFKCHNGSKAFKAEESCTRCHKK